MKQTLLLTNTTETCVLSLGSKLGAGGEGTVYAVQNDPSLCIKMYHEKHRTAAQEAKLKAMLAAPPKDPTIMSGHHSICWPTHLVYEDEACSKFLGFAMPRIDTKTFKEYHLLCDKPSATTTTCYRLEHFGTGFTYLHMYVVAMNLASCVASIHTAGHAVGDLNDKNILVSTHDSKITIVDCDSFEIHGDNNSVFPCAVFMPEYSAPEVIRQESIENRQQSDNFALAILIFKLLMLNTHPFAARGISVDHLTTPGDKIADGLYPYEVHEGKDATPPPYALDYAIIPPDIQLLFRKAFVDGHYTPSERPSAHDWITVLRHHFRIMYDKHSARKFMCTRNSLHYYPDHLQECPWCAMKEDYFPQKIVKKTKNTTQPTVAHTNFKYIIDELLIYGMDNVIDAKEYNELKYKLSTRNISDDEFMHALQIFKKKYTNIMFGKRPNFELNRVNLGELCEINTPFNYKLNFINSLLTDTLTVHFKNLPNGVFIFPAIAQVPPNSQITFTLTIDLPALEVLQNGLNSFAIYLIYRKTTSTNEITLQQTYYFEFNYKILINKIIADVFSYKPLQFLFMFIFYIIIFYLFPKGTRVFLIFASLTPFAPTFFYKKVDYEPNISIHFIAMIIYLFSMPLFLINEANEIFLIIFSAFFGALLPSSLNSKKRNYFFSSKFLKKYFLAMNISMIAYLLFIAIRFILSLI